MDEAGRNWFREYVSPSLLQMVEIRAEVYSGTTPYQTVKILDTIPFGRCLILDGKTQSAEADEFIYHEALVQPAMVTHPGPASVFIAGGGEGATLREALAHRTVKRAVMVDLDSEVVEICRRYLPNHHMGAFEDPRTELHHEDARGFLERRPDTYDVMLIDLPDPQEEGPAGLLYTKDFYSLLARRLNPGGVVAVQSQPCMAGNTEAFTAIASTLKSVFPHVFPYRAMVPSFSSDWGFNLASLGPTPLDLDKQEVDRRLDERGCSSLRFYDGETHRELFSLSRNLRQALAEETRVITEDNPLIVL